MLKYKPQNFTTLKNRILNVAFIRFKYFYAEAILGVKKVGNFSLYNNYHYGLINTFAGAMYSLFKSGYNYLIVDSFFRNYNDLLIFRLKGFNLKFLKKKKIKSFIDKFNIKLVANYNYELLRSTGRLFQLANVYTYPQRGLFRRNETFINVYKTYDKSERYVMYNLMLKVKKYYFYEKLYFFIRRYNQFLYHK